MTFLVKTPTGGGSLVRTAHGTEYVTVLEDATGKLATWHQSQVEVTGKAGYKPIGDIVTFKGCEYKVRDVSAGYALVDMYSHGEVTKLGKLIPLDKLTYV